MSKKGINLPLETIVIFIIILIAFVIILIFLFGQNSVLFQKLIGITNSTASLASEAQLPKP